VFRSQFVDDPDHGTDLWGDFVDPKVNAAEVLAQEIKGKKRGVVLLSSLTDPYQPSEYNYRITRSCLEVLLKHQYRVVILTKSDLVNRDLDIISKFKNADVGLTITTDDDSVRQIIEPTSPSIEDRITTLKAFHSRKVRTYVHIGPILPMSPSDLIDQIGNHIDYAITLGEDYFKAKESELKRLLERANIRVW
jgi:DNA repair photolyase